MQLQYEKQFQIFSKSRARQNMCLKIDIKSKNQLKQKAKVVVNTAVD